jgi:5-methylcytosine-specific restriction enzyme subunit McrC
MAKQAEVVRGDRASRIEIRNLYYMFLYAWGYFDGGEAADVEISETTDLTNLFAKVLCKGLQRLLRRGLDGGYRETVEETRSPRGRFLLGDSIKSASFLKSSVVCRFDEWSTNLLHNQIIKATLKRLLESDDLDPSLARDLSFLRRRLGDIADINLSDEVFHRVRLTRNTRHYGLLLKICQLLHDHLLVGEGTRASRFERLLNDEDKMHAIFQDFVRGFYDTEQSKFKVSAPQVQWDLTDSDPRYLPYLPSMYTDIALQSADRILIVDTKFYGHILKGRWSPKLHSSNLYQILTYVSQWHHSRATAKPPDGMLLYAKTVSEDLNLEYVISGYRILVKTLDMNKPWETIHDSLLACLG